MPRALMAFQRGVLGRLTHAEWAESLPPYFYADRQCRRGASAPQAHLEAELNKARQELAEARQAESPDPPAH